MNYLTKDDSIKILVNLLNLERIIPIFGSGFSGNMPSKSGFVPMGMGCTEKMKGILNKYSSLSESSIQKMDFSKTSKRFWKEVEDKIIPEQEYISFFRDYFTDVKLDTLRTDILRLPWHNVYTINIDDGIENTKLYAPILPYKNVREDIMRKDRVYKLHGDARYEIEYRNNENIVFNQTQYRHAMESPDNQTIRNNILTAYREFNIIYIGCSLENEPDLEWYYSCVKNDKSKTRIFYLCRGEIDKETEGRLEEYGVTDIIAIDDYDSFYIDFVHEFNTSKKSDLDFPFKNPLVIVFKDNEYKGIYGANSFEDAENTFKRSDLFVDRTIYKEVEDAFTNNNVVVLYGRRFSGRTSLLSQICKNEKTRAVYYFPSTSSFDFRIVSEILNKTEPALLLFDSNALQSDVYLGIKDFRGLIDTNNHHVLIVEPFDDTYLIEGMKCEVVGLKPRFDDKELSVLNSRLDVYGLIHRKNKDTNLDFLTRLKEEQKIDFPREFNLPQSLSSIEKKILLLLAAQDKVFSRDLFMLGINGSLLESILNHIGRLCEKIPTSKGEAMVQSAFKVVHNSRLLVMYLLSNYSDFSNEDVASNIKDLVETFYQGKDRMQKQIAISIMQFDTLNEIYGANKGAGNLIGLVYEELQSVLNHDPHYWLQRSKSIYRLYPDDAAKLRQAYQYCVKAMDDSAINDKLEAQTSLSLSLISGLLSKRVGGDESVQFAETCIRMGCKAMQSSYYSSRNRERLEKERVGRKQSYEELCVDVCKNYINTKSDTKAEYRTEAFQILLMIGDKCERKNSYK